VNSSAQVRANHRLYPKAKTVRLNLNSFTNAHHLNADHKLEPILNPNPKVRGEYDSTQLNSFTNAYQNEDVKLYRQSSTLPKR